MEDPRKHQPYILVNEFTEDAVKKFKEDFDRLKHSDLPCIPIFIDSFGGEIYSLMAMLDIMESVEIPKATIALGKAMSCGSILLASGNPGLRFIGKYSTVMIHDAGKVSWGKIEDLKADVREAERLNEVLYKLLSEKCNQPTDYFKKEVEKRKHIDWFLSAEEARKHKIVDHVGIPYFSEMQTLGLLQFPAPKKEKKPTLKKKIEKKDAKKQ
jgi:ATP-dependent Clp endopeptidase proteolytic subunit ClpP